jgi:VWFA-related protein
MQGFVGLLVILAFGFFIASCRSFDEAIKPVIDNAPPDSGQRLYVTGTRAYQSSDRDNLLLNVWRIDSDPFPDSVQVYTRVMDNDGNFISELAPPYYQGAGNYREIWSGLSEQIGDDGPTFEIDDFHVREFSSKDGIPFEIALALDYSGSMGSNISFLESAAVTFINLKLPQDRIAIVKFDDEARIAVPPTSDKGDLIAEYGRQGLAGYGGYTALYSAGMLGTQQVANAPKEHPRALILFTDGEDNSSTVTSGDLFKYCKEHSVPVFAVAFGAVNRNILENLALGTGGKFYQTNDPEELEQIFKDIYLSLRNYYLITYTPPRYDGKHIVNIALNPPGGDRTIAATAEYEKYGYGTRDTTRKAPTKLPNEVLFAYDSHELLPGAEEYIRLWAEAMEENPRMLLEIRGHTDSIGTRGYNLDLSEKRARAVFDAIVALGVDPDRLRYTGLGEDQPEVPNDSEANRARNRRTEFIILRE